MCEKATSHLFKVKEREMLIHTIGSHSQTREALQITDNDSSVIEVEWPEESQAPSIRFAKQDSEERQLIIDWYAKRFPTRLDLVKYCIERSKGYLDLSGLTALPEGVTFPKSCGYLDLSGLTALPEGVTFPEKIDGYLDLSGDLKAKLKL
jgi:hypothetical protein